MPIARFGPAYTWNKFPRPFAETFRGILCAVDLGSQSSRTLCWAAVLAREFGARLTLMHVTAPGRGSGRRVGSELARGYAGLRGAGTGRLMGFVNAEAEC